jgi:hypothetical protein
MDLEITWAIECRTEPDGEWEPYDFDTETPTEAFVSATTGPERDHRCNLDIVEWRLVKTTREVVRTKRRDENA